jgi:hypothetical protein
MPVRDGVSRTGTRAALVVVVWYASRGEAGDACAVKLQRVPSQRSQFRLTLYQLQAAGSKFDAVAAITLCGVHG